MRGCYSRVFGIFLLGFVVFFLPGCERSSSHKRIYDEIVEPSPALLPDQAVSFAWDLPQGWIEQPAGGMRLATITNPQSPGLEVSIVSLSGVAGLSWPTGQGGISANLNRWMKQIDLPELNEPALEEFLNTQKTFKTQGGLLCVLVDFTTLQPQEDLSLPGMLVGVVEIPEQTVFVKMTAPLSVLNQNRDAFEALCQSLKMR